MCTGYIMVTVQWIKKKSGRECSLFCVSIGQFICEVHRVLGLIGGTDHLIAGLQGAGV